MRKQIGMMFMLLLAVVGTQEAVVAQGIKTPAPSPSQTIKQDFALSSIELSYSRPSVKGRKIFGDLEPYGKVWRTGANAATKIKFGEDVTVAGQAVPAGEYAIYTIPEKGDWTFILSKNTKLWGAIGYDAKDDLFRVKVKPQMTSLTETFAIDLTNITQNTLDLVIKWEKTALVIPIKADIDGKVMKQISEVMASDKPAYFQAASYYFDNNKDLKQALAWADQAVVKSPDAYWVEHLKAKIQLKLGDKKGAIVSAESSKKKAEAQKNPDYVALNDKLIAAAKK